jgi:hypothetical protein
MSRFMMRYKVQAARAPPKENFVPHLYGERYWAAPTALRRATIVM